jgi:hypothetical protein
MAAGAVSGAVIAASLGNVWWIVWRSLALTVRSAFSTSFYSIVVELSAMAYVAFRIHRRGGMPAVTKHLKDNVIDAAVAVTVGFVGAILFYGVYKIPHDIDETYAKTTFPFPIPYAPYPPVDWDNRAINHHPKGSDSNIELPGFYEIPEVVTVSLGSVSMDIDVGRLTKVGAPIPLRVNDADPVAISLKKNRQIAFSFKSWAGVPVTVVENRVTIGSSEVDRNFSTNAFEIVDRSKNPIFQMIRLSVGHIQINGIFPLGTISPRTGKEFFWWVSPSNGIITASFRPPMFVLKPIFKYPAWKHPGQYASEVP